MDQSVFDLQDQKYLREKVEDTIKAYKMGILDQDIHSPKERKQMIKYYNRDWLTWFMGMRFDHVEIVNVLNKYTHCCDYLEEVNRLTPHRVEFACYVIYLSLKGQNVSSCDIFVCYFCFWGNQERFFALVNRYEAKLTWDCEVDMKTIQFCS